MLFVILMVFEWHFINVAHDLTLDIWIKVLMINTLLPICVNEGVDLIIVVRMQFLRRDIIVTLFHSA